MDLLFLLLAQVLPSVFYLTLSSLLFFRFRRDYELVTVHERSIPKMADVSFFLLLSLLMAVSFIADSVYLSLTDNINTAYLQNVSVCKLYIFSSLLPCVLLKYIVNFYKYGRFLYIIIAVLGVAVISVSYLSSIDSCLRPERILQRMAIGTNVMLLSAFLYLSVLRKDENKDIVLWKMGNTMRVYVAYYVFLTILFISYLLTSRLLLDYIITECGFVMIHFLLVYYKTCADKSRKPAPYPVPDEEDIETVPVFEDPEPESRYRLTYTDTRVEIDIMKDRVVDYLENKRMFLYPNLNMEKVANDLCTNKTYLSRVINSEMHKSFRELVNYFRVKEAIRIYNETQDISIEELSALSGFNNMASFTNAFKINTGKTPGEWCRDAKKNKKLLKEGLKSLIAKNE